MKLSTPTGNIKINEYESPVLRLYAQRDRRGRRYIDRDQLQAAERLRSDFERSLLQPRTTMSYAAHNASGSNFWSTSDNKVALLTDNAIAARRRFFAALDILEPELASICYHVCCLASGMEHAENLLALPVRSGKAILAIALNQLARHYGFKKNRSTTANITHWGTEGYRPDFILPPIAPPPT